MVVESRTGTGLRPQALRYVALRRVFFIPSFLRSRRRAKKYVLYAWNEFYDMALLLPFFSARLAIPFTINILTTVLFGTRAVEDVSLYC
jgi:hypothetical protein